MLLFIFFISLYRATKMFRSQNIINQLFFTGTFLICTALVTLSSNSQIVTVMEKEQAYLNFTYSCDIYEVVLQAGYKPPFYHSRNGGSLSLPPDQEHRFSVDNVNYSYGCSLKLTIMHVHKDDAATYICSIYKDIESLQTYKHVGLHVDYPPGKATCQLNPQHQEGSWGSMQCKAAVGSLPGKIECYQNGEEMPALTKPVETNESLKQTILFKYSDVVFCCSASFRLPKAVCECNDSIVDPIYNRHLNGRDVCSVTSPSKGLEPSSSIEPIISRNIISTVSEVATTENTPTNATQSNNKIERVIWICIVAFLFFFIILIIVHRVFMRDNGKKNLFCFSSCTEVNYGETENKSGTDIETTNVQLTEFEKGNETKTLTKTEIEETIVKIEETPL